MIGHSAARKGWEAGDGSEVYDLLPSLTTRKVGLNWAPLAHPWW